jgi:hypothetical protein
MDQNKLDELTPMETPPDVLKAMKELIADGENDVAKLPEPLFRSNLLPVLTDTSGRADMTVWLDIAGHGFRPIDVTDPVSGETLFRVPPMYQQLPTRTKGDPRHSLAMIAEQANNHSAQHPAIGQTFLRKQLEARRIEGSVNWEHVRTWNAILARYGLAPLLSVPEAGPGVVAGSDAVAVTTAAPSTGALIAGVEQDDF